MIGDGTSMKNNAIDRIFANFDKLVDAYVDLPETIAAEGRFWECLDANYKKGMGRDEIIRVENALYEMASCKEKQGFFYGFNFAMDLLGRGAG